MNFKVFNSCRIVKGAENALIYDLERMGESRSIPGSLFEILTEHSDKTVQEIKIHYNNEYDKVIEEYFEFLVENEFIFYCTKEELELFPTLDLPWNSPKTITNAIIDIDGSITPENYRNIIKELSDLGCEAVQIRGFESMSFPQLESFIQLFEETRITCVELILRYNKVVRDQEILNLRDRFNSIRSVTFYGSTQNSNENIIRHFTEEINPERDCGKIDSRFFSIGISTFSEAQCHNTCLNQKIGIDRNGCLKLCPSMKKSFGHIRNTTISDVVKLPEVKKFWAINKDEIEVCKDCEYRYCCTDCRAFTDNLDNDYSRPLKCDYNPYQGLWKGEDGHIDVNLWLNQKN